MSYTSQPRTTGLYAYDYGNPSTSPSHSHPPNYMNPSPSSHLQVPPAGRPRASSRAHEGPPPAPAGGDPQLWHWFTTVDTDHSGAISASELQRALLNGDWSNFDLDTVKMLMALFDQDRSGTITFDEFAGLWTYIRDWNEVFRHFDVDRSGTIDGGELMNALKHFGYKLSPTIIRLLEAKYELKGSLPSSESRYDLKPGITFDRFVRACVWVKSVTESFRRLDQDQDGWVQMDYETLMKIILSAP